MTLTLRLSDKPSRVTDAQLHEERSTSCVRASHCLLPPLSATSDKDFLRAPAPATPWPGGEAEQWGGKESMLQYRVGFIKTHTHRNTHKDICKQRHGYRCTWGHPGQTSKQSRGQSRWVEQQFRSAPTWKMRSTETTKRQTTKQDIWPVSFLQTGSIRHQTSLEATRLKLPELCVTTTSWGCCSPNVHCTSAASPPLWPWATHELSRGDQNSWPTVPRWEEMEVGNVAHSLPLTHETNVQTDTLSNSWRQKQLTQRISSPPELVHAWHSLIRNQWYTFTISIRRSCQILAFEVEVRRVITALYCTSLEGIWCFLSWCHWSWLGL